MLTFSGQRVLITGGNSHIALAFAHLAAAHGLEPVLVCRSKDRCGCAETHSPCEVESHVVDFFEPDSVDSIVERLSSPVQYLVDIAHSEYESLVASGDPDAVDEYFSTNLSGRFRLIRVMSRMMLKQRFGRMVFLSSASADSPAAGQGFYAATKLGAEALYRNVGIELGARGVSSACLRAGYVNTGRGKRFLENKQDAPLGPSGRSLDAGEVAMNLLWLLSDAALTINGTTIVQDGGLTAGKHI
ncbi:MAG: SDR family NAD(P)-dependent oxidoreductase [Desulfovibrio sp.]